MEMVDVVNDGEPTVAKLTGLEREASEVASLLGRLREAVEHHDSVDASLPRSMRRQRASARRGLVKQIHRGQLELDLLKLAMTAIKAKRAGACGVTTVVRGVEVRCELPVHAPEREHEGYYAEGALWVWGGAA